MLLIKILHYSSLVEVIIGVNNNFSCYKISTKRKVQFSYLSVIFDLILSEQIINLLEELKNYMQSEFPNGYLLCMNTQINMYISFIFKSC